MDEKVKIILSPKKPKDVEVGNEIFKVYPYISVTEKSVIIQNYVNSYFSVETSQNNYLGAEKSLMWNVISLLTNLDIGDETDFDADTLIKSGLWYIIVEKIVNFNELKMDLNKVISMIESERALEKSVGAAFTNISDKVIALISKLENIDVSQEGIKKLSEQLLEQKKSFEDNWGSTEPAKKTSRKAKIVVANKDKGLIQ